MKRRRMQFPGYFLKSLNQKRRIRGSILITGVYLSGQETNIDHIIAELDKASEWKIVQKWIVIGELSDNARTREVTRLDFRERIPKFIALNQLLLSTDLEPYDFIIICDDDIAFPPGFLDKYMELVMKHDFALAQPARTHDSYIDHRIVEQADGFAARRTRFVEIGPFFSVRKNLYEAIFPFDESSHMGWGYDFVWPLVIEKLGARMGIIDAVPVEHSMRRPVQNYDYDIANKSQEAYLSRHMHLSKEEAFTVVEAFSQQD